MIPGGQPFERMPGFQAGRGVKVRPVKGKSYSWVEGKEATGNGFPSLESLLQGTAELKKQRPGLLALERETGALLPPQWRLVI